MMKAFPRTRRVGEQIRRELAELIRDELRDPRLALVSMTSVEVSRDLGHAKVFITVMGENDEDKIKQNVRVLNDAAGYLRMLLGKAMKLRSVPQLHFHYDESITRGVRLSALIERAVSEDSKHQDD